MERMSRSYVVPTHTPSFPKDDELAIVWGSDIYQLLTNIRRMLSKSPRILSQSSALARASAHSLTGVSVAVPGAEKQSALRSSMYLSFLTCTQLHSFCVGAGRFGPIWGQ